MTSNEFGGRSWAHAADPDGPNRAGASLARSERDALHDLGLAVVLAAGRPAGETCRNQTRQRTSF
jgi:hypothetical protein